MDSWFCIENNAAVVMGARAIRRNSAAAGAISMGTEGADMNKRDWMHAIAHGAIFILSGALLAHTFL
jgi:hypothetical protein